MPHPSLLSSEGWESTDLKPPPVFQSLNKDNAGAYLECPNNDCGLIGETVLDMWKNQIVGVYTLTQGANGFDWTNQNGVVLTDGSDEEIGLPILDSPAFELAQGPNSAPNNGTPQQPQQTPQQQKKQPWYCGTGNSWSHPFTAPTGRQWGQWSVVDLGISWAISQKTGGKDPVSKVFGIAGIVEGWGWASCD